MERGVYRILENAHCPKETMQIDLDVNDLLSKITLDIKNAIVISIQEMPFTSLRMNGDHNVDAKFNNQCNKDELYKSYIMHSDFYRNFFYYKII